MAVRWLAAFVLMAIAALSFGLSYWYYDDGHYTLRSDERELIGRATSYVDDILTKTGRRPDEVEFAAWAASMDESGFRYEGRGFTYRPTVAPLLTRSAATSKAASVSFQFSFLAGGRWLTFDSSQKDKTQARIDDANYLFGTRLAAPWIALLFGGMLLLLARRITRSR
jgi:hypothetical protein